MARPMAASAAATVRMNRAKTCPTRSPRYEEKATKLMFTARRISSTDIRMMMMFLRLRKMPTTPMVKRMAATVRYWVRPICILSPLPRLDLDHVHGHRLGAGVLRRDGLAAHAGPRPESQHDGADH